MFLGRDRLGLVKTALTLDYLTRRACGRMFSERKI